ncbi:MAG: hypothetical protein KDD45_12375 [Bdellovibrionales bacterium]|nr:hypothetical protein [Bdellovibrionales bacterium]
MPAPKLAFAVSEIEKCNNDDNKLIINFLDKNKTIWEFQCPTKRCAMKWKQKIEEAVMRVGGR